MYIEKFKIAKELINKSKKIGIVGHENPDGDSIGSSLGLARALKTLNKEVFVAAKVPDYLNFLVFENEIHEEIKEEIDLLIVLDVDNNDYGRVAGINLENFKGKIVNIDHHKTNKQIANVSIVDDTKSATAEIILNFLQVLQINWNKDIANPILLGIITDTGSFQFSNTNATTFKAASFLLTKGAEINWLNEQRVQNPTSYFDLMKEALNTLHFEFNNKVAIIHINNEIIEKTKSNWENVDPLVNLIRTAKDTYLAILVKDFEEYTKISLRSKNGISAMNIAKDLGGGGHLAAAGAKILSPYQEIKPRLYEAIKKELEKHFEKIDI